MNIYIVFGGSNPDGDAKKEVFTRLQYRLVLALNAIETTRSMGFTETARAALTKLEAYQNIMYTLQTGWDTFTPEDFVAWELEANKVYTTVKLMLLDQN